MGTSAALTMPSAPPGDSFPASNEPANDTASAGDRRSRARTLPPRLTRAEKREGKLIVYPEGVDRPRTRGDCKDGPRPCPFVSCAHHLYIDVNEQGAMKLNFPDRGVDELEETCALDVADRGGETLERVGELLNVTRERVRQVEMMAVALVADATRHLV